MQLCKPRTPGNEGRRSAVCGAASVRSDLLLDGGAGSRFSLKAWSEGNSSLIGCVVSGPGSY